MEAGAIDADGYYHAQCQDLITDYVLWLTDNKVRTWGNAKDQIKQSYGTGFKIHENKPSTVPKKGWIAVFTSGSYEQWGHIGIVYDGGNTSTFTILEQNWNGYANKKPTKRVDNYYGLTHFIEIPVKGSHHHHHHGSMVIHNDAGRSSGQQYENSLANAGYARYANGIAHYYGSEGYVWEAIDAKNQIAWHTGDGTGANSGNFRFAGIEVCQSMSASDAQFLKNEQAVFQFTAEKFKEWGLTPNRKTVRLHMEFVPTACPH
nr:CHAP-amidase fusion protein [synthetic construct]